MSRRRFLLTLTSFLGACSVGGQASVSAPVASSSAGTAGVPTTSAGGTGTAPASTTAGAAIPAVSRQSTAATRVATDVPWNPRRAPLSPQQWADPASYPSGEPPPGGFWIPDAPEPRQPLAFGVLPPEAATRATIREFALTAPLPTAPQSLPVYLGGRYPESHRAVFDRVVRRDEPGWTFTPRFSSVWYLEGPPLGDRVAPGDASGVPGRAAQLLSERGLLLPDMTATAATREPDGTWTVVFIRRHDDLAVYSKSNLTIRLGEDGRLLYLLTHRRPLLARAEYPARPPEEAWRLLLAGRGRQLAIGVGSPAARPPGERFAVAGVEIAAIASEPFLPQQIVAPFYCFRDAQGTTLYVPAVADPYVEWWQ